MSENPGTLIGLSNIVTNLRARVPPGPDPDARPGLRDRLRTHAVRALEGRESFIHDAIVYGRRIRLFSNSHHLADFWRDNWLAEGEWMALEGQTVPREPALTVHAVINIPGEPEASYFSPTFPEAYLFNTSYYGDLRACSMEALGRLLGAECRVLHAGAVDIAGRGLLMLYPKEVIHPTPVWGLMELPGARFIADGWVLIDASGQLHAIEKHLYVRASSIEGYPEFVEKLLLSKFENVPNLTPALVDGGMARAHAALEAALQNDPRRSLASLPPDRAREIILRLLASHDARCLIDPGALFGKSRVARGPTGIAAVFLLRASQGEPIREAMTEEFECPTYEVNVAAVSGHPSEVARLIASR